MPTNNSINTPKPIDVSSGGTGLSTATTAYGVLAAGTTATGAFQNIGTGASGEVLTSNGAGALPTFQAAAGGGITGPGSSTDRAIATWNGTGGTALFNNSAVTIDSTGRLQNSAQPSFYASLSGNILNVTGDGTVYVVPFDVVTRNVGSSYNNATGVFTAPVTGFYLFSAVLFMYNFNSAHTRLIIQMPNGGGIDIIRLNPYAIRDSSDFVELNFQVLTQLTATNTVQVQLFVDNGTKTVSLASIGTYFSGALLF